MLAIGVGQTALGIRVDPAKVFDCWTVAVVGVHAVSVAHETLAASAPLPQRSSVNGSPGNEKPPVSDVRRAQLGCG